MVEVVSVNMFVSEDMLVTVNMLIDRLMIGDCGTPVHTRKQPGCGRSINGPSAPIAFRRASAHTVVGASDLGWWLSSSLPI